MRKMQLWNIPLTEESLRRSNLYIVVSLSGLPMNWKRFIACEQKRIVTCFCVCESHHGFAQGHGSTNPLEHSKFLCTSKAVLVCPAQAENRMKFWRPACWGENISLGIASFKLTPLVPIRLLPSSSISRLRLFALPFFDSVHLRSHAFSLYKSFDACCPLHTSLKLVSMNRHFFIVLKFHVYCVVNLSTDDFWSFLSGRRSSSIVPFGIPPPWFLNQA